MWDSYSKNKLEKHVYRFRLTSGIMLKIITRGNKGSSIFGLSATNKHQKNSNQTILFEYLFIFQKQTANCTFVLNVPKKKNNWHENHTFKSIITKKNFNN